MLKQKEYRIIDFFFIPLKIIPIQTIFAFIYAIVEALIPVYQTLVIGNLINTAMAVFQEPQAITSVFFPIFLIMIYVMFSNLMPAIANVVNLMGNNKLTLTLKEQIFIKRASLDYQHIEDPQTQELIHRTCSDPVMYFTEGFNNIMNAVKLIISVVSLLFVVMSSSLLGGLVIIIASIPLSVLSLRMGTKNYEMDIEAKKIQRRYHYLTEVLTNRHFAYERLLFNYSQKLQDNFKNLHKESTRIESKIKWKTYVHMKSGALMMLLIATIFILSLIPSVRDGRMSVGIFIALINVLLNLIHRMARQLLWIMSGHANLRAYLKDFNAFMKLSEKTDALANPKWVNDFKLHSIEFKNVSFKYPKTDNYILKNCSFKLDYDYSYAFVGTNGAGKSTIIKLLTGQYEDFEGEILINEKNIKKYHFSEIKGIFSVIFQDFSRFELTIKENIAIGSQMAIDVQKMEEIITILGLKGWIDQLPQGIETPLGKLKESGIDISGGQWQKIAIARLLYENHEINILDEPTAALDPMAESQIYELFSQLNEDRFTVYITHRLGAAKIADYILVLNDGFIVEKGSHDELISNQKGLYYRMFESQKSWYDMPHIELEE